MTGIKSSYEAALEKMKTMGIENAAELTPDQKEAVARIREEYAAKKAEKKILLSGEPELAPELQRLERECAAKIEKVYSGRQTA